MLLVLTIHVLLEFLRKSWLGIGGPSIWDYCIERDVCQKVYEDLKGAFC